MNHFEENISFLGADLVKEILSVSEVKEFRKGSELLREEQYVKVLPIVLNGLIKVYSSYSEKELLLYYIKPKESCVMSFSSIINNEKSKIFAITDEDSLILLLPASKIDYFLKNFPNFNTLFYHQYNQRYIEMIDTINHLLFERMDIRLMDYLTEKLQISNQNPLKISHREIANDLGTAREVISRVVKKLEAEKKVKQNSNSIEIL